MAFATTFRHSATEPARGREIDVNFDALGVYVDGTFLPLSGGTMTGNIAMGGHILTGLGAGAAAGNSVRYEQLHYTQTPVQGTLTTAFTTTSSTFQDSGLTATITPTSASHKVKISVSGTISISDIRTQCTLTVKRGSTDLSANAHGFSQVGQSGTNVILEVGFGVVYIDSPATTSATTYTVFIKADNNSSTAKINEGTGTAVIVLEEVL